MKRIIESRPPCKPAAQQFPEKLHADRLAVMRSTHATATNVYPMSRAARQDDVGARVVGDGTNEGAISALHLNASAHGRHEREQARKVRRAA